MFLNTLNHLNYHLTYRNLLKFAYQLRPASTLLTNENLTGHLKEDPNAEEPNKWMTREPDRATVEEARRDAATQEVQQTEPTDHSNSSPDKLTTYIERIRECKKATENTYLFIFRDTNRRTAIKLPEELNSKNHDYFSFRTKNLGLIDLDCGKATVDSIFQNSDEEQLGNSKFYHVKGPFLSSRLVQSEDGQPIKFTPYLTDDRVQLKKLESLSNRTDQLCYLLEATEISELEKRIKFTLINYLERNICSGVFDNFELIPFGSSFTGLGVCNSDLDLLLIPKPLSLKHNSKQLNAFIRQNNLTYLYKQQALDDKRSVNSCLKLINQILRLLPGIEVEIHITNAAVPIIKLSCPVMHVLMDISMSLKAQNNGVILMSQALYSFNELTPLLRQLYVVLRLWGHQANLIKSKQPCNHLKNFTFLMLLISFLQQHRSPLLPSMEALFCNDESAISQCRANSQQTDVFELIPEFFQYLAQANFLRHGIDLYQGKLIRNVSAQPMFIRNPFDPDNLNMTKNMLTKNVIQIKKSAVASLKVYNPNDLSTLFNDRFRIPDLD